MATSVKISQLGNIGTNISGNSLIPIVDVTGVATTDKVNVGNLGNFILGQAGNTLNAAFLSNLAYSVANAAQPNITSVGNLTNLTVVGATDLGAVGNVTIIGGLVGQVLSTDGAGNLSWVNQSGGGGGNIGNITFNGANISTDLEDTDIQIIANGTGNVNISSSAGNVWIFDADGVLTLPNADETGFGNIYFEENSSTITFGLDDNGSSRTYSFAFNGLTLPNGPALNTDTGDLEINVDGNVWTFDATGYLRIPNDGSFGALNSSILAFSSQNNLPIYIEVIDTGNSNIARQWVFDNSGNLTLPANTFQINYANGDPVLLGGGSSIANANSTVTIPDADGNVEIIAGYTSIAIGSSFGGSSPSGYLAGTFTNQPTSGGNGTGLTVNYTCVTINGPLTSIILNNPGSGYLNGDVVIIDGGNGPGLSATITLAVTTPGTWTFDTDGQVTLPDGTVMGDVEGSNTFGFYNSNPSTQFLLEAGTTAWIFDGANDNLTLPGDVNLPLVAKLNSGGVGITNAAEFGTEVTVDGSNIINGSQIYMGAGTAESRAIVNSDGNSLMYLGVENPGFAGMVGIDPGVTSEYAIQVGANNEIQIGAVVGPITTTEYVAGLGVLNANGNINGIFANGNVTVIGAGDLGWSFDSTGNLTMPGNIIVDVVGEADISSDANININAAGAIWTFGTDGTLNLPDSTSVGNAIIQSTSNIQVNATGNFWTFGTDGNTTFPAIGTADLGNLAVANNFSTNGSGGDITLTGGNITGANVIAANTFLGTGNLHLQPDPANVGSYLNVYLTVGPDVHIVSNDGNLILGSDTSANVMIDVDGNVSIQANTSTPHTWTFGSDGNLTLPGNLIIAGNTNVFGTDAALIQPNPDLPLISVTSGANGALATTWIEDIGNIGSSNIAAVYANPIPGSGIVRIAVGQNGFLGPNLWDFGPNGALTLPNNITIKTNSDSAIAIGAFANTGSSSAISIGTSAGNTNQSFDAIAIGGLAGSNSQSGTAIAIGAQAGANTQGIGAIALGTFAGNDSQGESAIAIGSGAGQTQQGNNSIILNASGSTLDQTTANTFTVAPVRNDVANIAEVMFYNATSKEVTYGNTISVAGNITGGNISTTGNITAGNIITGTGTTGNITGANVIAANTFQSTVVAFSALPAATTPGLRAFINNGNLAAVGNFGAQVAGGGANYVPVFSDGANWCIG